MSNKEVHSGKSPNNYEERVSPKNQYHEAQRAFYIQIQNKHIEYGYGFISIFERDYNL